MKKFIHLAKDSGNALFILVITGRTSAPEIPAKANTPGF
jgi:hypothetical protein